MSLLQNGEDSNQDSRLTLILKGEDTWYSKTFQKCEKGPSIKFLSSKGEEWGQGKSIYTCIVFMMLFYCLKVDKGERVSENHQIWVYILYGWSQRVLDITKLLKNGGRLEK